MSNQPIKCPHCNKMIYYKPMEQVNTNARSGISTGAVRSTPYAPSSDPLTTIHMPLIYAEPSPAADPPPSYSDGGSHDSGGSSDGGSSE